MRWESGDTWSSGRWRRWKDPTGGWRCSARGDSELDIHTHTQKNSPSNDRRKENRRTTDIKRAATCKREQSTVSRREWCCKCQRLLTLCDLEASKALNICTNLSAATLLLFYETFPRHLCFYWGLLFFGGVFDASPDRQKVMTKTFMTSCSSSINILIYLFKSVCSRFWTQNCSVKWW